MLAAVHRLSRDWLLDSLAAAHLADGVQSHKVQICRTQQRRLGAECFFLLLTARCYAAYNSEASVTS